MKNVQYNGTANWTFAGIVPGEYEVWVTWATHRVLGTAPYEVFDGTTSVAKLSIPQNVASSGMTLGGRPWKKLGKYSMKSTTLKVKLSPPTVNNKWIGADAVAIKQVQAAPQCGNSITEPGEICDDGNAQNGDGCSAQCTEESGNACGNGVLDQGEECEVDSDCGGYAYGETCAYGNPVSKCKCQAGTRADVIRDTIAHFGGDPSIIEWDDFLTMLQHVWEFNVLDGQNNEFDFDGNGFIDENELHEVTDALVTKPFKYGEALYGVIGNKIMKGLHPAGLIIDEYALGRIEKDILSEAMVDKEKNTEIWDITQDGYVTIEDYHEYREGMNKLWLLYRKYSEVAIENYLKVK